MINIITGKPGTGKTYYLAKLARKFILSGLDIYSNFFIDKDKIISDYEKSLRFKIITIFHKIFLEEKYQPAYGQIIFWEKLDEFIDIRGGEVLIDECQIYFNSRKWKDLPERIQYKFQQHRKHIKRDSQGKVVGLNIWGAVQNVKRIDTVVRELVNNVFIIKKIFKLFIIRQYDIEEIDKEKKYCYSTNIFTFSHKVASSYDTFQEIAGFSRH